MKPGRLGGQGPRSLSAMSTKPPYGWASNGRSDDSDAAHAASNAGDPAPDGQTQISVDASDDVTVEASEDITSQTQGDGSDESEGGHMNESAHGGVHGDGGQ